MRLGFTSVTFRKKTPEEICILAKENGARFIEWGTDVHVKDTADASKVKNLCDRYGITTITLGSYYRLGENHPEEFKKICDSAVILGAKRIRVWAGSAASADTEEALYASYVADARNIAAIAGNAGLEIGMEYHKKTFNDTPSSGKKLILDCGRSNFRTMWQPFSYENDPETLKEVLPDLCEVHVFAWDKEYNRYPLEQQKEKWENYFHTFRSVGPDCILEFVRDDSEAQFADDFKTASSLLAKSE